MEGGGKFIRSIETMEDVDDVIVLCFGRRVLNLTPHKVCVRPGGCTSTVEIALPSAGVARAIPRHENFQHFKFLLHGKKKFINYDNVEVYSPPSYVAVEGLPPQDATDDPVDIIVSMVVAQAMKDLGLAWRGAVFTPNTSPQQVIRDADGKIEAVRSLIMWSPPKEKV